MEASWRRGAFTTLTQRLAGASLLVLANKQDLPGALSPETLRRVRDGTDVQYLRLDDIQSHSWRIQACSAHTGAHMDEGLDWLLSDMASRLYYYSSPT